MANISQRGHRIAIHTLDIRFIESPQLVTGNFTKISMATDIKASAEIEETIGIRKGKVANKEDKRIFLYAVKNGCKT